MPELTVKQLKRNIAGAMHEVDEINRLAHKTGGNLMHTFEDYKQALEGAGPKFKELALDKAAHDPNISLFDLRRLVDIADPDCV